MIKIFAFVTILQIFMYIIERNVTLNINAHQLYWIVSTCPLKIECRSCVRSLISQLNNVTQWTASSALNRPKLHQN